MALFKTKDSHNPVMGDRDPRSSESGRSIIRPTSKIKSLSPLKLSSPSLPESVLYPPTTPAPTLRTGGAIPDGEENLSIHSDLSPDFLTQSSVIRSAPLHRDIPIYSETGSPLLGHAYYNPSGLTTVCSPSSSSRNEPSIANDDNITRCEGLEFGVVHRNSIDMRENFRHDCFSRRMSASQVKAEHRDSALSFQCIGESLFSDEAAWLENPLNLGNGRQSECLQNMPMERNIEAWLSDTGSREDDILGCATALVPAKAHVIDVNTHQPSGISIRIPPRSSSLGTTDPNLISPVTDRVSWMASGGESPVLYSERLGERGKSSIGRQISLRRTPSSSNPGSRLGTAIMNPRLPPTSFYGNGAYPLPFASGYRFGPHDSHTTNDSLHTIVSALEDHMVAFPTNMLLVDSKCTLEIRAYLHSLSEFPTKNRRQRDAPISPAISQNTMFLGQDHSSANASCDRGTIHKASPANILGIRYSMPSGEKFKSTLLAADIEPLRRIFPGTSNFMCSALYAHVLAYLFLCSLALGNQSAHAERATRYYRTSATSVPEKAASLLGITELEHSDGDAAFPSATMSLESQIQDHIGTLVSEMENSFNIGCSGSDRCPVISEMLLRSLVEVVSLREMLF